MKKIKFIAMAMLALLTAQCKKNEPEPEPKVMVPISGSVSFGGGSKTEITTTGYVTPKSGDTIYIYHAGNYVGSLTCTPGTGQAFTCSGEIERSCLGEACTFMYLGSDNSVNGESTTISFADQTGISANSGKISGIDKFHVGSCKANVSDEGTVSLPMRTKISIAYFQLKDQNGSAMANKDITISGVSATATIIKTNGTLEGEKGQITVHTDENGRFYMALVPQSGAANFTFTSANANGTDVFPYGIGECCFYSEQGNVSKPLPVQMNSIVTPELLTGKFSVSADKYVQFSRGNLYCTDKGSNNYEFSFEQNQYDYRCRCGKYNDRAVINGGVTTTPPLTSGLFEWIPRTSTSATADWGAFSRHTSAIAGNKIDDVLDFGGVFPATGWTTFTSDEWQYLLYNHSNKIVTVNGVKGLCIAPDDYSESISNQYSSETWAEAETAGLVFLPYYGYYNPEVDNIIEESAYWSSTANSENIYWAQALHFYNSGNAVVVDERWRTYCQKVRLVQKFEKPEKSELLPGKFTIDGSGTQVQFSRGNLFCVDKGSNKYDFRFEAEQYHFRTRNQNYPTKTSKCYNEDGVLVTTTPSGTSGLFQWIARDNTFYANDYWGAFDLLENFDYNKIIYGNGDLDWGQIYTSGDGNTYFTLSNAQWNYLISTRSNAANLIVCGSVDGVAGLILAPDGHSSITSKTSYSKEEWNAAETDGLVFLPATGTLSETGGYTDVKNIGQGYYWTCKRYDNDTHDAWALLWWGTDVANVNVSPNICNRGCAVRLVSRSSN